MLEGGDSNDTQGATQSHPDSESPPPDTTAWLLQSASDHATFRATDVHGDVTTISLTLPEVMSIEDWAATGIALGRMERAVGWWIGDWWIYGEHTFGERTAIVRDSRWTGPSLQTCKNAAVVSRAFQTSRRRYLLSFSHHMELCGLSPSEADRLLDSFVADVEEGKAAPPRQQVRQIVKGERRTERERELGEKTRTANAVLDAEKKYGVIYADPPWRFEPRSRETGMDRSPDNHYPTMTFSQIVALSVPSASDCVIFLWATVPMLPEALDVLTAWGFDYKSHIVWRKDRPGTGYWVRCQHELLLIGTKGSPPAPAPGEQPFSVLGLPLGDHSEKPDEFALIIEGLYPTLPRLEMFARAAREGWDVHGNEAPVASGDDTGDPA